MSAISILQTRNMLMQSHQQITSSCYVSPMNEVMQCWDRNNICIQQCSYTIGKRAALTRHHKHWWRLGLPSPESHFGERMHWLLA